MLCWSKKRGISGIGMIDRHRRQNLGEHRRQNFELQVLPSLPCLVLLACQKSRSPLGASESSKRVAVGCLRNSRGQKVKIREYGGVGTKRFKSPNVLKTASELVYVYHLTNRRSMEVSRPLRTRGCCTCCMLSLRKQIKIRRLGGQSITLFRKLCNKCR